MIFLCNFVFLCSLFVFMLHTNVCKIFQGMVCCPCVHNLSFMHQSEVVKLLEDGVAWLVDGEDYSFTSSGQSEVLPQNQNRRRMDICFVAGTNSRKWLLHFSIFLHAASESHWFYSIRGCVVNGLMCYNWVILMQQTGDAVCSVGIQPCCWLVQKQQRGRSYELHPDAAPFPLPS